MTESEGVIRAALRERILILDGAMGTTVQARGLEERDFRGERFADHPRELKGDTELLSLTRPDVIEEIHEAFFEAGADIVGPTPSAPRPSPRATTSWRDWPAS